MGNRKKAGFPQHECIPLFSSKIAVVFGNEALGVSRDVIECCDCLIEIPTYGFKNSLNVATSCSVIGYKILEKILKETYS